VINRVIEKGADFFRHRKEDIQDYLGGGILARIIGIVISVYLILTLVFGWWWSQEPEMIDIQQYAVERAGEQGHAPVTGYTTTTALIYLAETMLDWFKCVTWRELFGKTLADHKVNLLKIKT
jgi:hypothetical protein